MIEKIDDRYYSTSHRNAHIEVDNESKEFIKVKITGYHNGSERETTVKSKKLGPMTKEQVVDFVKDCLNKFCRNESKIG